VNKILRLSYIIYLTMSSKEEEQVDDRFDLEDVEAFARDVGSQLETQALNSLVTGFSFAAAMSWMDVSRYVISRLVKGNKNTGLQYTLTAVTTTLLSILVFMGVSAVSKKVVKPSAPMFAIAR